jgi:polyphosphate kinase 2 (PPK2 family)
MANKPEVVETSPRKGDKRNVPDEPKTEIPNGLRIEHAHHPNAAHELAMLRHDPKAIVSLFREGKYPYKTRMTRGVYEKRKAKLQIELLKVQNWVKMTGQKILILFEGRDAAGKGGTIKRFTEHLNPRAARVVALQKPTETESGQWYFQRYIEHLPTAGEMVFLDRSWYNRAGVERVMGFCNSAEYLEFMRQGAAKPIRVTKERPA